MNINQVKYGFNKHLHLTFILLLLTATATLAEPTINVFSKTIILGEHPIISYSLYDVSVEVIATDKQELKVEMEYVVDGKPDEVQRLKEMLEKTVVQNDSREAAGIDLSFQNNFELEVMGMKWSKLTFKSDTKETIKLKEFKVKRCRIWMPRQSDVKLHLKYSTININEDVYGSCIIDLYDSKIFASDILNSVVGEAKYSSLSVGNTSKAEVNLYEGKLRAGDVKEAIIKAKYSSIEMNEIQELKLEMYEGSAGFKEVHNGLITNKYAHITISKANELDMSVYEGSLIFEKISDLSLNGKYMELKGDFLDKLSLHEAYESEVKLNKVNAIESKDGKYNEFNIGHLGSRFVHSGYEDEIEISSLEPDFEELKFQGKYIEIALGVPVSVAYVLKGNVQYPSFSINEANYTVRKKIGDSSMLEFNYEFKNPTENSPCITIEGYEVDFSIYN